MGDKFTVLISGAPGTGKTTLQRMAPSCFRPRLGETAAMGTDEMYTVVDPDWSLQSEAQAWCSALARRNCAAVARNCFDAGVNVALIAGNALFEPAWVNEILVELLPVSSVYHFTLDASVESVVEWVKDREPAYRQTPEWYDAWLRHVRSFHAEWTHVIDTDRHTPAEILDVIADRIRNGEGRITQLLDTGPPRF